MATPMTDLETGPSSIRDDSICESSLHPNKSSGDIVERTWTPEQFWEFTEGRDGEFSAQQLRDVMEDVGLVIVPAAEIERLRRERDEARTIVVEANNSLYGSQGYFHSTNGGPFDKYHLARPIEELKSRARDALTAESAVAAAWEEAVKIAEDNAQHSNTASQRDDFERFAELGYEQACEDIASAIRAAVEKKTAED
jgi:hypothetical protein